MENPAPQQRPGPFRLWAFGDAHVGTDQRQGRKSLEDALRHSLEGGQHGGPPFEWDIAVDIGDNSGGQSVPQDDEGEEVVRQFSVLGRKRQSVYNICGNHDRSGLKEPEAWWFQKWIDPTGAHSAHSGVFAEQRPFPVQGTWERYSFRAGNLLFLLMSDINEPTQKIGRGDLGGNPGGAVRGETFAWWRQMVQANPDCIIVSAHHYMLKDTTTASGEWEGMARDAKGNWHGTYHGYKPLGTPSGASYLYWVDSQPDAQAFEKFLAARQPADAPPGSNAIALWLGGHTHPLNPEDNAGNKPVLATKWGVHFANVCPLTHYHCNAKMNPAPSSRRFTFTPGSDEVLVECYLHTNHYAPQGWYPKAQRLLKLPRAFQP